MEQVTAGIIEKDGKILIAKRKTGTCVGAKWEFPGGKFEPGESPEQCLKREIKEELNFDVEIREFVAKSRFSCGDKAIELLAYRVKYISGDIELTDHEEVQWVLPSELKNYEFTLPDVPVVREVEKIFGV